jgi:hypothetical protein
MRLIQGPEATAKGFAIHADEYTGGGELLPGFATLELGGLSMIFCEDCMLLENKSVTRTGYKQAKLQAMIMMTKRQNIHLIDQRTLSSTLTSDTTNSRFLGGTTTLVGKDAS